MGKSNHVVAWRRRFKEKAITYKGGVCISCTYKGCQEALGFHHLDPSKKDFSISSGIRSWASAKVELDKCVLMCCRCHTELHAGLLDIHEYLHRNPSPEEGERLLSLLPPLIRKRSKTPKTWFDTCQRCGAPKSKSTAALCKRCGGFKAMTGKEVTSWPDYPALQNEVAVTSIHAVAHRLGVSWAAVKKRLDKHKP